MSFKQPIGLKTADDNADVYKTCVLLTAFPSSENNCNAANHAVAGGLNRVPSCTLSRRPSGDETDDRRLIKAKGQLESKVCREHLGPSRLGTLCARLHGYSPLCSRVYAAAAALRMSGNTASTPNPESSTPPQPSTSTADDAPVQNGKPRDDVEIFDATLQQQPQPQSQHHGSDDDVILLTPKNEPADVIPVTSQPNPTLPNETNSTAKTSPVLGEPPEKVIKLSPPPPPNTTQPAKRKEIYRFVASDLLYTCSWSNKTHANTLYRFAVATCKLDEELEQNTVTIVEYDSISDSLFAACTFDHGYPPSCVKFTPHTIADNLPELLATASHGVKIYRYEPSSRSVTHETTLLSKPYSSSCQDACVFTSLDWNAGNPDYVVTACIDTTCTLWNLEYGVAVGTMTATAKQQLIAHEKPVNSVAFSNMEQTTREQFATASSDGSVRLFDARNLQHSAILFEDAQKRSLNHISWNHKEPYVLAIVPQNSREILLLDIRKVHSSDSLTYNNHNATINHMAWAPHSDKHICTAGADSQALIWQIDRVEREEPILAYKADGEIVNVQWSAVQSEWISIVFDNCVEILRV